MKNKKTKFILLMLSILLLTGCTKNLKNSENKIVTNEKTGQSVTENIICRPTDEDMLKIYEDNNVDISKLPECKDFTPITDYEGLWTSFFVKPLAWVILKIGSLVKNNGLAIIITCLLIRCALIPVTRKTAMQSEMMKKAQPELERLEKKYAGKETTEDQQRKAQEMMMIYQKYKINPISGCLLAIIQLPLLFAFLEAINRTPAIFENKFLVFEMGTTVPKGIASGNYWYIILIILILGTTYLSFRKTLKDQSLSQQGGQMKFTLYFMLVIIAFASFSLPTALGLYWIASSTFTIVQNLLVERKKK
mgnify:FL=1